MLTDKNNKKYSNEHPKGKKPTEEKNIKVAKYERSEELKKARKKALERYKGKLTTEEMFSRGLFK